MDIDNQLQTYSLDKSDPYIYFLTDVQNHL